MSRTPEKIGSFGLLLPPKPHWSTSEIPDLTGKVAFVTGGNTGVGKETCLALAAHGAKVYLGARSEAKAEAAIADIKAAVKNADIRYHSLDLASLAATKESARHFLQSETELHMLFLNAGVMTPPKGSKTSDGYELQWGTNVLGHYLFTQELLPALRRAAQSTPPNSVRIIHTSSMAHRYAPKGGVLVDALDSTSGMTLYGQSKIANIIVANHWADVLGPEGILSASCHPGLIKSDLQRNMSAISRYLFYKIAASPATGALTQLYIGTAPEAGLHNGSYWTAYVRLTTPERSEALDPKLRKSVVRLLDEQVKKTLGA